MANPSPPGRLGHVPALGEQVLAMHPGGHHLVAAEHWTIKRMPLVDRNLLRLATFALLARPEVLTPVVLDQAIELAKLLSTADSGRFVNGVLGHVAREVRGDPAAGPDA
jgi:hypothetical protein